MGLLCIRQPYYFHERYVEKENFSISFFFTMRSTYISSEKSGSENVAQKRARTNWLCNVGST